MKGIKLQAVRNKNASYFYPQQSCGTWKLVGVNVSKYTLQKNCIFREKMKLVKRELDGHKIYFLVNQMTSKLLSDAFRIWEIKVEFWNP